MIKTIAAVCLLSVPVMAQAPAAGAKTADQGNTAMKPPVEKLTVHGGMHFIGKEHAFEVVLHKDATLVYIYNMKGEPSGVSGTTGNAILKIKGGAEKNLELKPVINVKEGWEYLKAAGDIVMTKDPLPVTIKIKGFEGTEKDVSFDLTFTGLSPTIKYTCDHCKVEAADPGKCSKCKGELVRKVVDAQPHTQG